MSPIKGVIVAAGYGSRFLPASKTVPKEMLPLIDTPAIEFVLQEFIDSGIEDILIISSRRKKALDDYLDYEMELETTLGREGKEDKLGKIAPAKANIYFTRQRQMLGTGHAIYQARSFVGNSPFVVAYPDDLFFGGRPVSGQLIELYSKTGMNVLAAHDIGEGDISKYAALAAEAADGYHIVQQMVEKPPRGQEPSKLTSYGRYLFTPEFFEVMEKHIPHHQNGELYHTVAINELAKAGKVAALEYEGERYDTGYPLGMLEAILVYGLSRSDIAPGLTELLQKYSGKQT